MAMEAHMDGPDDVLETPAPAPAATRSKRPRTPAVRSPVDVPYALWLATVATALMGAISVVMALILYLIDNALSFSGEGTLFGSESYIRMLELSAIFAALAILAHLLRLRLEAMRTATVVVPLPNRIAVQPPSGDLVSQFEISCKISIALDHDGPANALISKQDVLKEVLENAFLVAVTDPDIRFSKDKMAQTLKVAAVHVLGKGIAYIEISEIRQRRLPPQHHQPQHHQPPAPRPAEPIENVVEDEMDAQAG